MKSHRLAALCLAGACAAASSSAAFAQTPVEKPPAGRACVGRNRRRDDGSRDRLAPAVDHDACRQDARLDRHQVAEIVRARSQAAVQLSARHRQGHAVLGGAQQRQRQAPLCSLQRLGVDREATVVRGAHRP